FMVTAGLGEQFGGLLVSLGLGGLFSAPLWGWLARVIGLRWVLLGSYAVTGLCTVTAATLMDAPWLGAAVLLMAAMGASAIDAGGNTLFLRAVHPYERGEMAAVFSSYRDIAQIVPPAVFAALLAAFELPAVFAAGAVMMLTLAAVTLFIPRRF
ncbi:MAG: MFS transporter, partial [Alphaproteobacteria bacterium]|nr:MFS transporter [Alphaproteobacteria bacterium]